MSRVVRLVVVGILVVAGCSGDERRFCEDCRAIRSLQAKSNQTETEKEELKAMKEKVRRGVEGLAEYQASSGQGQDLHPGCDCPCHLAVIRSKR